MCGSAVGLSLVVMTGVTGKLGRVNSGNGLVGRCGVAMSGGGGNQGGWGMSVGNLGGWGKEESTSMSGVKGGGFIAATLRSAATCVSVRSGVGAGG
jgi:hypothetical protein